MDSRTNKIMSFSFMSIVELCWAFLWLLFVDSKYDLYFYVSLILLGVILYPLGSFVFSHSKLSIKDNVKRENIISVIGLCLMFLAFTVVFFYEPRAFDAESHFMPWHYNRIIEIMVVFGGAGLTGFIFLMMYKGIHKRSIITERKHKITLLPYYAVLSLFTAYSVYQPNVFTSFFSIHHVHAYFQSVYRVMFLQPYTEFNTGVYGFYGIILAPFTKLLGGDVRALMIVLCILIFLSMLCYFYVLEYLVKKTSLRAITALCMCFFAVYSSLYLQVMPHRLITVGYVLAYIVFCKKIKKNRGLLEIGGIVITCFSLLWNLEVGLVCLVAYYGNRVIEILQKESLKHFHTWLLCLKQGLFACCSILLTFFTVCVYDLAVSGHPITLKAFLFPFNSTKYFGGIHYPLDRFPSMWMLVLVLFLVCIAFVLGKTALCNSISNSPKISIFGACVIAAVLQLTYYINRTAYGNFFIIIIPLMLIVATIIEYTDNQKIWTTGTAGNGLMRSSNAILKVCVLWVVFIMLCSGYSNLPKKAERRDTTQLNNTLSIVEEQIPKDTLGIGIGVTELYSYLGWDTNYYGIDSSDIGTVAQSEKDQIFQIFEGSDTLFTDEITIKKVNEFSTTDIFDTHYIQKTINIGGINFYYICRK